MQVGEKRLLPPVSLGLRKVCGLLAQESLRKIPWGKRAFSRTFFPGFLGPEAHKLFVTPAKLAEAVFSSKLAISPKGVQEPLAPGACFGRRDPRPVVPFVIFFLYKKTIKEEE